MRLWTPSMPHRIQRARKLQEHHIGTRSPSPVLGACAELKQHIHREPNLEVTLIIDLVHFLVSEG